MGIKFVQIFFYLKTPTHNKFYSKGRGGGDFINKKKILYLNSYRKNIPQCKKFFLARKVDVDKKLR